MFRKGNRWLAAACISLLLEAAAHTLGTLSPLPDDPRIQTVVTGMQDLRMPMGLGMSPSAWDIHQSLAFFMTVALAALGALGLAVLAAAPDHRPVLRAVTVVLLIASICMLVLWWIYQVPPPLVSQAIVTALFAVALARTGGKN